MSNTVGIINRQLKSKYFFLKLKEKINEINRSVNVISIDKLYNLDKVDAIIILFDETTGFNIIDYILDYRGKTPFFILLVGCSVNTDKLESLFKLSNSVDNLMLDYVELSEADNLIIYKIQNFLGIKNSIKNQITDFKDHNNTIELNPDKYSVTISGSEILFTFSEFVILEKLVNDFGKLISYENLNSVLKQNNKQSLKREKYRIANIISRIRNKLKSQNVILISVIRNKGYAVEFLNQKKVKLVI